MTFIVLLAVGTTLGFMEAEHDGIRVRAEVKSSHYTWEITNLTNEPVVRFEIGQFGGYAVQVPEGWQFEQDRTLLRAWTDDPAHALQPGLMYRFAMDISSAGGGLTPVTLRVGTRDGRMIELAGIWGTAPDSMTAILLVPGTILVLALIHMLLLARSDRRHQVEAVTAGPAR